MVELLAPVGSFESLAAALRAGADAVYFGVRGLNMRAGGRADFVLEDVGEVVSRAHAAGARAYLTLNVITYDEEGSLVARILDEAKAAGVDAVICWDPAVIEACRERELPIHISTQASISNFASLRFYASLGASTVVLARELTLEQIRAIIRRRDQEGLRVRIEAFIHGAMCIAVSGRCFMSQIAQCKSANRGECLQMCRRAYTIKDEEEGTEFLLENNFVMSPKDLCALPVLDRVLDSGIDVLKIEGRMRGPEYVGVVVESYKEAVAAHERGVLDEALKGLLLGRMERVYNKGFSTGFYNGRPLHEWAGAYGNKASTRKEYVGRLTNYFSEPGVAEVKVESNAIAEGEGYYLIGPTTGVLEGTMPQMLLDGRAVPRAEKGMVVTFRSPRARVGDRLYIIRSA